MCLNQNGVSEQNVQKDGKPIWKYNCRSKIYTGPHLSMNTTCSPCVVLMICCHLEMELHLCNHYLAGQRLISKQIPLYYIYKPFISPNVFSQWSQNVQHNFKNPQPNKFRWKSNSSRIALSVAIPKLSTMFITDSLAKGCLATTVWFCCISSYFRASCTSLLRPTACLGANCWTLTQLTRAILKWNRTYFLVYHT